MSTNPEEATVADQHHDSNEAPAPTHEPLVPTYPGPPIPAPPITAPGTDQNYGQPALLSIEKEQQPLYGSPAQYGAPYVEPAYASAQQGYQQPPNQYQQQQYGGYGQQPQQGYGNHYPAYPQSPAEIGRQAASTSLTMGIIAACLAVLIGWIPFFGLLGVAGGVGLGIPAILGAKRAEENGVNATWGKSLGWVAIGFSALWVALYVFLFVVGSLYSGSGGTSSM